jgi:uncharacterized membrane protein
MNRIEKTFTEKMIEMLALAGVVLLWAYPARHYGMLPDTIPVHFNGMGEADGFGSKAFIWFLPAIGTLIIPGLLLLSRFPHKLNYPVKITPENAERQYGLATRLVRYMALSVVTIFNLIIIKMVKMAESGSSKQDPWFLPVILILVLGPVIYFVFKMIQKPTSNP